MEPAPIFDPTQITFSFLNISNSIWHRLDGNDEADNLKKFILIDTLAFDS